MIVPLTYEFPGSMKKHCEGQSEPSLHSVKRSPSSSYSLVRVYVPHASVVFFRDPSMDSFYLLYGTWRNVPQVKCSGLMRSAQRSRRDVIDINQRAGKQIFSPNWAGRLLPPMTASKNNNQHQSNRQQECRLHRHDVLSLSVNNKVRGSDF